MFDEKKVSRERVIGISFADILIQAVFVLLLALIVGYVDPVEKLQIKEFEEVGKDLCKKLNKDSIEACREFIKINEIGVTTNTKFNQVGSDVCAKLNISDPIKCSSELEELLGKNNLRPCIKSNSKTSITPSIYWIIHAPDDIEFDGFSSEYLQYVQDDLDRSQKSLEMNKIAGKHFRANEIKEKFDFVRESTCFHSYSLNRKGAYSDSQISREMSAIRLLRSLKE